MIRLNLRRGPRLAGIVHDRAQSESRHHAGGAAQRAIPQHPVLRTVGIDRGFYSALAIAEYAAYANQVPDDFRLHGQGDFRMVTDEVRHDEGGRSRR